ncbi:MAG: hypothetical protein ABWY66_09230, partial [Xanthobacteraceae bacterium]
CTTRHEARIGSLGGTSETLLRLNCEFLRGAKDHSHMPSEVSRKDFIVSHAANRDLYGPQWRYVVSLPK